MYTEALPRVNLYVRYEQGFGICPLNDEVFIRGKIDRVDEGIRADGRKVFRVIDYKTGSTQFSLSDIRNGINMQLFIYALAAMKFYWRGYGAYGRVLPACA